MRDVPDYFWEWTELDFEYNTGMRLLKPDTPPDILKQIAEDERQHFNATARRCVINLNLETGELIPVDEAVERYRQFEAEKTARLKSEYTETA